MIERSLKLIQLSSTKESLMDVAIVVYDGFTGLDAIGPYEVLSRLPDARVRLVAVEGGTCAADLPGLEMVAEPLSTMAQPDVIVVTGGTRTPDHLGDDHLVGWLREADADSTWTTSVCTGSLLLGAAGLLEGRRATSHWYEVDSLSSFGAIPTRERVVVDGKIVTAAGVSAGIDMALLLCERIAGESYAQQVQLNLEYDPQPPLDAGSVTKAPPDTVEAVRAMMLKFYGPPWAERTDHP
jgi:transcriptional regulator GlxA family with amidase domain